METKLFGMALILVAIVQMDAPAVEPFRALDEKVTEVLKAVYPEAVLERDSHQKSIRTFAHNPREFTIYRLDMGGDWQKPMQAMGPDRGGISVRFHVEKGRWEGQLAVPPHGVMSISDDLHVFQETTLVGNSQDGNWHLCAQVVTPKVDAPKVLVKKLIEVFDNWEKYKD